MIKPRYLVFWLIMLLTVYSTAVSHPMADEKKALKHLERKEYDKVIETLVKDLEKDTLNPGTYYVFALLYHEILYEKSNLDTAYHYILKARELYSSTDEKEIQKLVRNDITENAIVELKKILEQEAFTRAMGTNSIAGIKDFLSRFGTSNLVEEATRELHALAFGEAENNNTYQAYYKFMNSYPESAQFEDAKDLYEKLLYQDQTSDGKLKSYEDFLIKFPHSPYLKKAMEVIYQLRTVDNTEKSLLDFISDYPESGHVKEAINRLYFNFYASGHTGFSYTYNILDLDDSIRHIEKYSDHFLVPLFEEGKFGFMTDEGEVLVNRKFDGIIPDYLCGNITDKVLVVNQEDKMILVSTTGETIYDGHFYNAENLGNGLIKLSYFGKYGLMYADGKRLFDFLFDEIELLDHQLLKAESGRGWQLYSLNGVLLTNDYFEEIERQGNFLFLRKEGKWAVTKSEWIFQQFNRGNFSIQYVYDDFELIEPSQVLCFQGNLETVIGNDLQPGLTLKEQQIYALPDGWLVREDSIYHIYDDAFYKISGTGFSSVEFKGPWIKGKHSQGHLLFFDYAPMPDVFQFDSVNILSDRFVMVIKEGKPSVFFINLEKRNIVDYESIRVLYGDPGSASETERSEYLLVEFAKGNMILFNAYGKNILKGNVSGIQPLGSSFVKYESQSKTGLIDSTGKTLIKPKYEGIANYSQGDLSLFSKKKFGLYNKLEDILIEPAFERILKRYNTDYLIAYQEDGYGLIDAKGNEITPFISEEIRYWNDTAMVAREDGYWHIIDIRSGEMVLADIYDFNLLNDQDEKIMLFLKEELYGVVSNTRGIIINNTFNDIINLGNDHKPLYFAEKFIPEAGFYIVLYYDGAGKLLRKQVFDESEYDKIYCN